MNPIESGFRSALSLLTSVAFHGACVVALVTASPGPQAAPEGSATMVDFQAPPGEKPNQGQQTKVVDHAKQSDRQKSDAVKVKTAKKMEKKQRAASKIATVLPQKSATAKAESKKSEAEEKEILKPQDTVAVAPKMESAPEKEPAPKFLPVKEEPPVGVEPADETDETAQITKDDFDNKLSEQQSEQKTEAEAVTPVTKDSDTQDTQTATAIADAIANPPTQATGKAPSEYGIPSGARSYLELRQVAGNRPPQYPLAARRLGEQGDVVLSYYVTDDGRVTNMKVVQSSGYRVLDNEAQRAISQYRFVPGQAGWARHPVHFTLKGPTETLPSHLRTMGASDVSREMKGQ